MRSSVSVILSSPTPDPNMSRPDYMQTVYDHSAFLILVRQLGGELSTKHFNHYFDRISRIFVIKINDNVSTERTIYTRYVKEYPVGNNDWGDFQTHRRLLGLITIGKCKNQIEFNEICRIHESLKVKYQSTLYDSRCVVFGVNTIDTVHLTPPSNFKSIPLYYSSETEANLELESQISEFVSALFWILESKRLERAKEKIEKVPLLLAPFEKRDFVGLDMESRSNRKRCTGRLTKHLGDLSLQAGLIQEALTYYHSAIDILRSINDWLWIANSAEGLCAASALNLFPKVQTSPLHRNASLQERNTRQRFNSLTSGNESFGRSTKSMLSLPQNILFADEIYKSYKEAIVYYSQYQHAAVIEMEACFKAARIAVEHNSPLHAHSLLQNVIFISLTLNEDEKIQRLMTLSELYTSIGFRRKASFYRRLTATRYVSARNPETNWDQCYQLMLQSLPGHNLTLDPNDYAPGALIGWPRLQRQVLQDLVVSAKRFGNPGLATRHMTFLLQTMWHHMTPSERQESAYQLQALTGQCEGSPVPLVLDSGLIIPPANLLNIPQPLNFVVQNLKVFLRPHKLQITKEDYGPFLFTPLSFGSLERKNAKKPDRLEYQWVVDEICEVILEICNPLSFELEVTNILLLSNGAVFESIPLTVTLPSNCPNLSVVLTGVPKEPGELEIVGYSTHTLGVKSNCRLRYIPNIPQSVYTLEVIPALPTLQISNSLQSSENIDSPTSTVVLYAGESSECIVYFKNIGTLPIEMLEVIVESQLDPNQQRHVVQWSEKTLQDQLPLTSGATAELSLFLFGASNFLVQPSTNIQDVLSAKSSMLSGPSSVMSVSSSRHTTHERRNPMSMSTFSYRSTGGSSLNSYASQFKTLPENSARLVECHVKIRYSGGPGMAAGYCRVCSLTIYIEILNSLLITNWDVLPAETCSQFYLVLDVANMTNHEMEVKYTKSKVILIEEAGTCRIPVPVDRCPINATREMSVQNTESAVDTAEDVNKSCSVCIASQVDLHWILSGITKEGHASLNGLMIADDMLDLVRMSPIHWEVSLNSTMMKADSESKTQTVGEILQIGIWVHNTLAWPLANITLQLYFFQDYQNGVTNNHLESCLSIIGSTEVILPQILEFGSVYHECNAIFFNTGQFKLNIQCSSIEKHTWKLIPPIEVNVINDAKCN